MRALAEADPSGRAAFLAGATDSLPLTIILTSSRTRNSAPILRLTVPVLHVDRPPEIAKAAVPAYPKGIRDAERLDGVTLRYIIDSTGATVPTSIRVLGATDSAFVDPAIRAVLNSRFKPARIGRCAVAMRVEQTVRFHQSP